MENMSAFGNAEGATAPDPNHNPNNFYVSTEMGIALELTKDHNVDLADWKKIRDVIIPITHYYAHEAKGKFDSKYDQFFDPWNGKALLTREHQEDCIRFLEKEIKSLMDLLRNLPHGVLEKQMYSLERSSELSGNHSLEMSWLAWYNSAFCHYEIPMTVGEWLHRAYNLASNDLNRSQKIYNFTLDQVNEQVAYHTKDLHRILFLLRSANHLEIGEATKNVVNHLTTDCERRAYLHVLGNIIYTLSDGIPVTSWAVAIKEEHYSNSKE